MEALVPLLAELNDLKRQSTPLVRSLAGFVFESAWQRLLNGEDARSAALSVAAQAIAAARLGGIDEYFLLQAGFDQVQASEVLERSFDAVASPLDTGLCNQLRPKLCGGLHRRESALPTFVKLLAEQPRAGATRPGHARVMLLPAESHADHCACVAIYAVLLSPRYGADCTKPFLAALIHHAHNAWMPDAGFAGEEMLGEHLGPMLERLRERAYAELPVQLRQRMREALEEIAEADTPEAKAFHAADVLDRVLQMRWYEQAARFTLKVAMEDMELVHAGPVQAFHNDVLPRSRFMVNLLRKQDRWARTAPPSLDAVERLTMDPPATLREAMQLLNYGPVGDYFAYRWSDPTFLSGLALLNLHRHTHVLELACGIGHYCRELALRGVRVTGADVVYSKVWLAKQYVAPEADFVCLDAAAALPFPDKHFSTAFCHDAFYFLPNKAHVARELQRVAHTVLIGHTHNAAVANFSSGEPLTVEEYAELFPGAVMYDDAELTQALLEDRLPQASRTGAALAFAPPSTDWTGQFTDPPKGAALRENPLLSGGRIAYPSERYEAEYGSMMGYITDRRIDPVRRRALVSLPERW